LIHRGRGITPKDQDRHKAFDQLLAVWDDETAAAVYQMGSNGVYGALDLLNLQSTVDNRREINQLRRDYEALLQRLSDFEKIRPEQFTRPYEIPEHGKS